jgi:ParB-like chromosome segregation protein Spo0J
MATTNVPLDKIDPNPWQPRQKEDKEHIYKIALSIVNDGLMQIPTGREIGERVQLAFGHSRLAAYQVLARYEEKFKANKGFDFPEEHDALIAALDAAMENGRSFQTMPVNLADLSDEQMFRQAVSENLARKDLNALEEAAAMKRYRDEFGKTSVEIGKLFGKSDSTVRGKMRLLELPEDVQQKAAHLPEVMLRELVSLYQLPKRVWEMRTGSILVLAELVTKIISGKINDPQVVRTEIENILRYKCKDMAATPWKFDQEFLGLETGTGTLYYPDCKTCDDRLLRDGKNYCLRPECYAAREKVYQRQYLAQAAKASGIPIADQKHLDDDSYNPIFTTWEYQGTPKDEFKKIVVTRCSNLRLYFNRRTSANDYNRVDGYPNAQIICQKRGGFCTCSSALKVRGVSDEIKEAAVAAETAAPVLDEERLKEIARRQRQQKRDNKEMAEQMRRHAISALVTETESLHFWKTLAETLNWSWKKELQNASRISDVKHLVIGYLLDHQICNPDGSSFENNPAEVEDRYNGYLRRYQKELPFSVKTSDEVEAPTGKTLVEVFGGAE